MLQYNGFPFVLIRLSFLLRLSILFQKPENRSSQWLYEIYCQLFLHFFEGGLVNGVQFLLWLNRCKNLLLSYSKCDKLYSFEPPSSWFSVLTILKLKTLPEFFSLYLKPL